jgi:hypothetical protein
MSKTTEYLLGGDRNVSTFAMMYKLTIGVHPTLPLLVLNYAHGMNRQDTHVTTSTANTNGSSPISTTTTSATATTNTAATASINTTIASVTTTTTTVNQNEIKSTLPLEPAPSAAATTVPTPTPSPSLASASHVKTHTRTINWVPMADDEIIMECRGLVIEVEDTKDPNAYMFVRVVAQGFVRFWHLRGFIEHRDDYFNPRLINGYMSNHVHTLCRVNSGFDFTRPWTIQDKEDGTYMLLFRWRSHIIASSRKGFGQSNITIINDDPKYSLPIDTLPTAASATSATSSSSSTSTILPTSTAAVASSIDIKSNNVVCTKSDYVKTITGINGIEKKYVDEWLDDNTILCVELCSPHNRIVKLYSHSAVYLIGKLTRKPDGGYMETPSNNELDSYVAELRTKYGIIFARPWTSPVKCNSLRQLEEILNERMLRDPTTEGLILIDEHQRRLKLKTSLFKQCHAVKYWNSVICTPEFMIPLLCDDSITTNKQSPSLSQQSDDSKSSGNMVMNAMTTTMNTTNMDWLINYVSLSPDELYGVMKQVTPCRHFLETIKSQVILEWTRVMNIDEHCRDHNTRGTFINQGSTTLRMIKPFLQHLSHRYRHGGYSSFEVNDWINYINHRLLKEFIPLLTSTYKDIVNGKKEFIISSSTANISHINSAKSILPLGNGNGNGNGDGDMTGEIVLPVINEARGDDVAVTSTSDTIDSTSIISESKAKCIATTTTTGATTTTTSNSSGKRNKYTNHPENHFCTLPLNMLEAKDTGITNTPPVLLTSSSSSKREWKVTCYCGKPMELVQLKHWFHIPTTCHCGISLKVQKSYKPLFWLWKCQDNTSCVLTMEAQQEDVIRDGLHLFKGDPLGLPASGDLKNLRLGIHGLIRKLMKQQRWSTLNECYKWLSGKLDIPVEKCHMAIMNIQQCYQIIRIIQDELI